MTEYELRAWVCAVAKAWLGRKESDGSHREIIDVYNAGRVPGSYAMTYEDPWCAAFVSAVGMKAGCGDIIIPNVACDPMIGAYEACGGWREEDDFDAQAGDLIFYDWQDSGAGDNRGSSDHVGLVVDNDGRTITVIEGNCSDMVKYRTIPVNGKNIRGFAVPDYRRKAAQLQTVVNGDVPLDPEPVEIEPLRPDADVDPDPQQPEQLCTVRLPVLREDCVGEGVRNAQRLLIDRRYSCGGSWSTVYRRELPDGDYGPVTKSAVRQFQESRGLPANGVIDAATWSALLTT